jgi:hypothetical protein
MDFENWYVRARVILIRLRIGATAGLLVSGSEFSGSIHFWEFLE